ncbi:hypothetical protein MTO96_001697 [Rhipicephalus appendiculatus]
MRRRKAPCDLIQIGETFQPSGYGVVVSHKSPLKKILDVSIARLQEDEELYALYKKWFGNEECHKPQHGLSALDAGTSMRGVHFYLHFYPCATLSCFIDQSQEISLIGSQEEGVETQLLQPGTNPSAYTGGYVGGADLTIEEVGEEDEDDEVVKVPIADVENLTDSADDSRDITRDVTADRIVPLAVNPSGEPSGDQVHRPQPCRVS